MSSMKVILRAHGPSQDILFEVGTLPVTVGRQDDCIVRLKDQTCSHHHCMFWVEGKKLFIEDNNSKNGTFVNSVRITRNQVFIQDKIVIGDTTISVSSTHNMPEVIKTLNFPGNLDDRTSIGIVLQTSATLDLIRLNPRSAMNANPAERRMLGKRITQKIIRPRGYQQEANDAKWQDSWRHWLALVVDVSCLIVAFAAPFIVMLWFDKTLDAESSVRDLITSPNLAIASLGSLLSGFTFRHMNVNAPNGTIGMRLSNLAEVSEDQRKRRY